LSIPELKNIKKESIDLSLNLNALEQNAALIIDTMTVFDFETFSKHLYSEQMVRGDVYSHYDKMIISYNDRQQLESSTYCGCAVNLK
jgi:hypothetical protein